ncbi:hypothetical protein HMPREF1546_03389 [Oscillibacter sp. KLE 1745]|nr:hypothetical protein HMPREF1546_03389 [Oscillibacter sp. KLE 1745]
MERTLCRLSACVYTVFSVADFRCKSNGLLPGRAGRPALQKIPKVLHKPLLK